jgi:hypothetical protein
MMFCLKIDLTYEEECKLYSKSMKDGLDPEFVNYLQSSDNSASNKYWNISTTRSHFEQRQCSYEHYFRHEFQKTKLLELKGKNDGGDFCSNHIFNEIFTKIEFHNIKLFHPNNIGMIRFLFDGDLFFSIHIYIPSPHIKIQKNSNNKCITDKTFIKKLTVEFDPLMDLRFRFCNHHFIIQTSNLTYEPPPEEKITNPLTNPFNVIMHLARDRTPDSSFDINKYTTYDVTSKKEFFARTKVYYE